MALPPITVELTVFAKIEILRQEIEKRKEELKETEKTIRQVMTELERQKYLKSLHALFQQIEDPPQAAQLNDYVAYRDAVSEAVAIMQQTLTQLETETKGATPSPGAGGQADASNVKFDSFESFKNKKK